MTLIDVDQLVQPIRSASRKLVRELGFLNDTLANSGYPPSAVHAILEIGSSGPLKASDLCEKLGLEKSSVSRMIHKLVTAGELSQTTCEGDARTKHLSLTSQGRQSMKRIDDFAERQVAEALRKLSPSSRLAVRDGLQAYADALGSVRTKQPTSRQDVRIESGFQPGALGRIVEMHARYYAESAGFGSYFEAKVAWELAEFTARLDKPANGMWLAVDDSGAIFGSIVIDGEDLGPRLAHLRWFIIDDSARGRGIGRLLLQRALSFIESSGFAETHLWTFQGLDAARHLYEAEGFVLVDEVVGDQWGVAVKEQKFVRRSSS